MPTVKELFEQMPASFDPAAAAGIHALILFNITGQGGAQYCVSIDDGTLSIVEGGHEAPDLTISADANDYIDISSGALNEQLAFMTGRITARGNTLLAMKLPKLFNR